MRISDWSSDVCSSDLGRGLADLLAQRGIERRRRGFLDDLLEAALDRAFALEHVHDAALAVAEYLHFDMARVLDIAFDVQAAITEVALAFTARAFALGVEPRQKIGRAAGRERECQTV